MPGETLAWDRAFAIENGSRDFDEAAPRHFPKIKFLMLMKQERLATLKTRFDGDATTLTISLDGRPAASGNLMTPDGRAAIERFFERFMPEELRGTPRIVHAPGFSVSDVPVKCLSIISLASVRALERQIGAPVDPLRFRGNVYVEGLEPWAEHDWAGRELRLGDARLRGLKPIKRCAATNVDPETGARNMDIPRTLTQAFDHMNLGLYAEVETGGVVRPGDTLALSD